MNSKTMKAYERETERADTALRPRFETHKAMLIAGLRGHYTSETLDDIPALWARFVPHLGNIPGQLGEADYGLCIDMAAGTNGFDYVAGVEVADLSNLPADWAGVRIPAQSYAIFPHHGHVSTIQIRLEGLERNGCPVQDANLPRPPPGRPI